MRYLSLVEILELHEAIIANTGGARGIRDVGHWNPQLINLALPSTKLISIQT